MKLPEFPVTSVPLFSLVLAELLSTLLLPASLVSGQTLGRKDRSGIKDARPKDACPKDARPVYEHPTRRKRVGQTTENCFVRKREAGDADRRRRNSGASLSHNRAGKRNDSDSEWGSPDVIHAPVSVQSLRRFPPRKPVPPSELDGKP